MTEQSNAELIAKANKAARFVYLAADESVADDLSQIIRALAERLEAADQRAELAEANLSVEESKNAGYRAKNNQLAAVVEKVREADRAGITWGLYGKEAAAILAEAPAVALAEHDAALIEGLADDVHATLSDPNRKRPRDPRREFATDLLNDVEWAIHLIREKARQRREEKDHD